jgi:hypothetical protein
MIGNDILRLFKPESGHSGKNFSLTRDGIGHNDVKSGDSVRGDNEKTGIQVINIPHFSPAG